MQISAQIYGLATKNRGQGLAPLLHRIQDKRFTLFRSQKGVRAPRIVAINLPIGPRNTNRPYAGIETFAIPRSVFEQLTVN